MKFNKKKREIFEKLIAGRLNQIWFEERLGSSWYKIKKLTDTHVIFKSLYDKTEVKYFFSDDNDLDEKLLEYLIRKHKNKTFGLRMTMSIEAGKKIKHKKYTRKEKEDMLLELVDIFGKVFMSEYSEVFDISIMETRKIMDKLTKEGKIK